MSNHPNRGPAGPASNPTPEQVKSLRIASGLTQTAAAALVHSRCRSWQQWESGDRRMHPSTLELFKIKVQQDEEIRKWADLQN